MVERAAPNRVIPVRVRVGPQMKKPGLLQVFLFCGRRSDDFRARKSTRRGRGILRVTTSKISVTAK